MRVLVAALAAALVAADNVSPAALRGDWKGTLGQSFAAASPTDPNSLECIQNGGVIGAENVEVSIDETSYTYSGSDSVTGVFANKRYVLAPTSAVQAGWSEFQGDAAEGIMMLRGADDVVTCHYAKVEEGSGGAKPTLTIVTLGGAGFTWQDQCQLSTYQSFGTTPFCESDGTGSKAPYKSSVVLTLKFLGSRASGAGKAALSAALGAAFGGALLGVL